MGLKSHGSFFPSFPLKPLYIKLFFATLVYSQLDRVLTLQYGHILRAFLSLYRAK